MCMIKEHSARKQRQQRRQQQENEKKKIYVRGTIDPLCFKKLRASSVNSCIFRCDAMFFYVFQFFFF